jgi:hypothetical protein
MDGTNLQDLAQNEAMDASFLLAQFVSKSQGMPVKRQKQAVAE